MFLAKTLRATRIAAVSIALLAAATFLAAAQPASAGEASLVAGEAENTDTQAATVKEPKYASVKKVKLNKKKVRIKNNGTFKLKARLVPTIKGKKIKRKDAKITWYISNSKIASITQEGVVRGKTAGTAIVTAKAPNGKKARAKIKVKIEKNKMATRIPVLTYHRICANSAKSRFYSGTNLAMSASLFNSQMKWLKNNGYHTISTGELRDWRVYGAFLPKKSVLITIDDGFYETYHVAYPILKKYGLKATSFVIGSYTPKKTAKYNPNDGSDHYVGRDVIKKVRKDYPNLEFQSHTYNMHHRNGSGNGVATSWSRAQIDADFAHNEKFDFTSIAYPYGHTSANLLASVRANKSIKIGFGYMMTWPATRTSALYNMPRFKVFGDRGLGDFISIVRTAN